MARKHRGGPAPIPIAIGPARIKVGFAVGALLCRIKLPAAEIEIDRRCSAMSEVRRFIRRNLPSAPAALEGATFTVSAMIRAQSLGVRWKVIGRWKSGDSIDAVLQEVGKVWAELPKEERWVKTDT